MTDISKIDMERINGLLDKLNEVTNKINSMKYVIETGQSEDGSQWYRKWNDGWCEQGGQFSASGTTTINLLIPYKDTNYQVTTTYKNSSNSANIDITWGSVNNVTNSSFTIQNSVNTVFTRVWKACGYTNI